MIPEFENGNILADCPTCNARCTFEYREPGGGEFGSVVVHATTHTDDGYYRRIIHKLVRCSTCKHPGIAKVLANDNYTHGSRLDSFWPTSKPMMSLPDKAPEGVEFEFREAEVTMSVGAWRGAAALLRSSLEKVLIANGFGERDLFKKIEAAGKEGVITSARRQRAQDFVRTLGNDVLHDEWRVVTEEEVAAAHHYVGRIIEDLYDDRATVESVLLASGRIKPADGS